MQHGNIQSRNFEAPSCLSCSNEQLVSIAYAFAFRKAFSLVTEEHPEFNDGQDVKVWIVDFSMAQHAGLSNSLGEDAPKIIRGCDVHFKRMAKKIAEKVCQDRLSKRVFKKIAYEIPLLETKKEVTLAFNILRRKVSFDQIEARDFLTLKIKLDGDEMETTNAEGWEKAEHWAEFWTRDKVVKMFTKAFKEMTDADWNICPRTTNAVESQNALGKINSKTFLTVVENLYETDRNNAYSEVAAARGIKTGTTEKKRAIKNQKRKSKIYRPRVQKEDDSAPPSKKKKVCFTFFIKNLSTIKPFYLNIGFNRNRLHWQKVAKTTLRKRMKSQHRQREKQEKKQLVVVHPLLKWYFVTFNYA